MKTALPKSIGRPATSALQANNIISLEDLSSITEKELAELHGVGPKAISILKQALDESKMCLLTPKNVKPKKSEVIDGYMIKYHANGVSRWSKGKIVDGQPDGYWEWYRPDGTLKRSGYFKLGEAVGEWTTYDDNGKTYKVTSR
jgi:antitoxin component YwqK of YwqJK toxin-antitoxin module